MDATVVPSQGYRTPVKSSCKADANAGSPISTAAPSTASPAFVSRARCALVSGGNRGIGLEVVRSLLEDEARHFVYMGCRDMVRGKELEDKLQQQYGPRVRAVHLEVTSADSIAKA